jgi:hypothetical protein
VKGIHPRTPFRGLSLMCREISIVSLSPIAPTLKYKTSVKRFVSLQFLNPERVGRTRTRD